MYPVEIWQLMQPGWEGPASHASEGSFMPFPHYWEEDKRVNVRKRVMQSRERLGVCLCIFWFVGIKIIMRYE